MSLPDLERRLDAVLRGPSAIEAQLLFRIARPVLSLASWRASIAASKLGILVGQLRERTPASEKAVNDATRELAHNVSAVERATIVQGRPPVAHVLWLRRVHSTLTLIQRAAHDPRLTRIAARTDPAALFPPLVPLQHRADEDPLVDIELAAIDHLIAAARAETMFLGRKRRLLVAARQRLLEAAAALPIARDGLRERTRWISRAITRVNRCEAAGLDVDVSLVYQARQALVRRDATRLHASLASIDAHAIEAGDHALALETARLRAADPDETGASVDRSMKELLGSAVETVTSAVTEARNIAVRRLDETPHAIARAPANAMLAYLPEDAGVQILRAAVAADGLFEVGGSLTPVRVLEESRVLRVVEYPTPTLVLRPAEDVRDIPDALVGDPRSILLDLAAGRLFARRYVREIVARRPRIVRRGEVRVYLLDGSGSMKGPRARVRDALLVAELSTLMHRLAEPGDVDCTLFFRYFDEVLGPVTKVNRIDQASAAIREVVATKREGGTDIQAALLASIAQVVEARATIPALAHAQIVLVTDGDAPVDEPALQAARAALSGIPVGVSVIALGEENAALRALVARQRAMGERAFYHFLDDDQLAEITGGEGSTDPIHAPARWLDRATAARTLEDETADLVDELERIEKGREHVALEELEAEAQARRELGVVDDANDGAHARIEAQRRDRIALAARFDRWFPEPVPTPSSLPTVGSKERADVDAACCVLASVAEVVALLGGPSFARQADAIDLLQRLLPDAHLATADYRGLVRTWPGALAPGLSAVRAATTDPAR